MAGPILNTAFPGPLAAIKKLSAQGVSAPGATGESFSALMKQVVNEAVDRGNKTEAQAVRSLNKSTDVVDVVTAVTNAEVTLETAMAVRDRMIAAYQEILRMPI